MKKIVFFMLLMPILGLAKSTDTLSVTKEISDYGPIIHAKLTKIIEKGGGTLYVRYGKYPMLTQVAVDEQNKKVMIAIVGLPNAKGELPLFFDTDSNKDPHNFFAFTSHIINTNMSVSVSDIEIRGNNVPYSTNHPFFKKSNKSYSSGINFRNLKTAHAINVRIENVYGNGIVIGNWFDNKKKLSRCESPSIKNCIIAGTWAYNAADDTGDGIMLWSCNKAIVENNRIINDLSIDKMFGRGAVIVEHYCEKAIIRNNYMVGFMRSIHAECDYGGHLIENNTVLQCDNGVTFSEDCGQTPAESAKFSPSIVRNNSFTYADETKRYNLPKGDRAFISFWKANFVLKGLRVENNRFYLGTDAKTKQRFTLGKQRKVQFDFRQQDPEIITKGNLFNTFEVEARSETPLISVKQNKIYLITKNRAKIFYTTDGSDPGLQSKLYTKPVALTKGTKIKAIAMQVGKAASSRITEKTI